MVPVVSALEGFHCKHVVSTGMHRSVTIHPSLHMAGLPSVDAFVATTFIVTVFPWPDVKATICFAVNFHLTTI